MDVALSDGVFIRMAGPAGGRSLLFIHALADCGLAFTPLFATPLAETYRLIAIDLPGFGASPRQDEVRAISQHADAVAALARVLPCPGPIGLVGHSVGSMIAVEAASRLGERFGGLFSIEGNLTSEDAYFSGRAADIDDPQAFKRRFLDDLWDMARAQPILRRFHAMATMADAVAMWHLGRDARRLGIDDAPGPSCVSGRRSITGRCSAPCKERENGSRQAVSFTSSSPTESTGRQSISQSRLLGRFGLSSTPLEHAKPRLNRQLPGSPTFPNPGLGAERYGAGEPPEPSK